jgi:ubiquinone/menaquinone biosynthesis C-methylase UbiE
MNHDAQHKYFDTAYRTGSDLWTHVSYIPTILQMMPSLLPDTIILDVGAGRGVLANKFIELGYRVIGIDYVRSIVDSANQDLKINKLDTKGRFIHGTATDLPFTDSSFVMITDIGLLQHLSEQERTQYLSELSRVTQTGGYVLCVTLSSETPRYMGFTPKIQNLSPYEKFGVTYNFFSEPEINELFGQYGFSPIRQQLQTFETRTDPGDSIVLLFTLFQKK